MTGKLFPDGPKREERARKLFAQQRTAMRAVATFADNSGRGPEGYGCALFLFKFTRDVLDDLLAEEPWSMKRVPLSPHVPGGGGRASIPSRLREFGGAH